MVVRWSAAAVWKSYGGLKSRYGFPDEWWSHPSSLDKRSQRPGRCFWGGTKEAVARKEAADWCPLRGGALDIARVAVS